MKINKKILAGLIAVSMLGCGIWMESVSAAETPDQTEAQETETEPAVTTAEDITEDITDDIADTDISEPDKEESGQQEAAENVEELETPDQTAAEEPQDPQEPDFGDAEDPESRTDAEEKSGFCGAEEENAVAWNLDETGTLTITGQGNMTDWETAEAVPWNGYRDQITKVEIAEGVTSVGAYAFAYCENLTELDMPDSVQNIGAFAYFNCDGLSTLTIG